MRAGQQRQVYVRVLRLLRDEVFDGSGSALARAANIAQSTMSRYLRGKNKTLEPYERVLDTLRDNEYPVDEYVEYAESDDKDMPPGASNTPQPGRSQTSRMGSKSVRVHTEVQVGAGTGEVAISEWAYEDVSFPRAFLRTVLQGPIPQDVRMVRVDGHSMYPEIQHGDWVLFTPRETVSDGAVQLIRLDGELMFKIVQRKPGRRIRIHSLNPTFTDDVIEKCEDDGWTTADGRHVDFAVVGMYLHVIRQHDILAATQRVADAATIAEQMGAYEPKTVQ